MSNVDSVMGVTGQTFWVVGAGGGGIGTASSLALARAGARVVALDIDEAALAPAVEGRNDPGSNGVQHVCIRQPCHEHELVSAHTRCDVLLSGVLGEGAPQKLDGPVAAVVPKAVVGGGVGVTSQ